jgi:hypothetical protein
MTFQRRYREYLNGAARLLLIAFVVVCVFDPADRVFAAKVWLFVALWGVTLVVSLLVSETTFLPIGLLVYVLLSLAIPLLSILWYYLTSGDQPYHGFNFLKGYLLVSLAIILVVNRVDLVPILSAAMTVLAVLTIAVYILLLLKPQFLATVNVFNEITGAMIMSERRYGNVTYLQMGFVTAPMLAISIPQYFDRAMTAPKVGIRFIYFCLLTISIVGMMLTGLRNTIAAALFLPLVLWPLYTRRIVVNTFISLGALAGLTLLFVEKLKPFLDPAELSNNVRLSLLRDYGQIFSDPLVLLFGQGLGAYRLWSTSGRPEFELTGENFYFNTELTYAEMIRYFGLPGAAIMMALLFFPIAHAFFWKVNTRQRALSLGFLAYLVMGATNPLLFSSSGFIILSALLANTFRSDI